MNILFVTSHLHLPQLHGGIQATLDQLCHALITRGHRVAALTGLDGSGSFGMRSRLKLFINRKLTRHKLTRDSGLGYPVFRTWHAAEEMAYVASVQKPDIIVVLSGDMVAIAMAARGSGIPLLLALHDVQFQRHGGDFASLASLPCIANSQFTADTYRKAYGIDARVIYPFIDGKDYVTETRRANVTFINPHPMKGRNIAVEIARGCPDIPFAFVRCWTLASEDEEALQRAVVGLPNVILRPACNDMRKVYGDCKILLAPSLCEEAFGRVAAEAQFSGIPVIASRRGGLPEAVGPGGVLVDPESDVQAWVDAVRRLWDDADAYHALSMAARAHALRPEMDGAYQVAAFERVLVEAVAQGARA